MNERIHTHQSESNKAFLTWHAAKLSSDSYGTGNNYVNCRSWKQNRRSKMQEKKKKLEERCVGREPSCIWVEILTKQNNASVKEKCGYYDSVSKAHFTA